MVAIGVRKQEELQGLRRSGTVKVSSFLLLLYYFLHSSIFSSSNEKDNDGCHCHL